VWFAGCGGAYSYACTSHLAAWAVEGCETGYRVVQVSSCETQEVLLPLVREVA